MKNIKRALLFVCAVVVLQGLALLFLTPAGLDIVYQIPLRINAESFKPENNTYVVYYDTRVEISDADLVVVGIDDNIAQSYDVLGHFTRFLKQYNNISAVMLDLDRVGYRIASGLMSEDSEEIFYSKLAALGESVGLSTDYLDYFSELFVVNSTMPPVRKFDIMSYSIVGDELTLAEQISDAFDKTEKSALCVVDSLELSADSTFRAELDALMHKEKVVYIEVVYTESCESPETHYAVKFPFEADEPTVYFVNNGKFSSYYSYYNKVVGLFGTNKVLKNRLDTRYTDYFFVISKGTLAK